MNKHIGTKIFSFLFVIVALQLIFIVMAFSGLAKIRASNDKTMDIYVEMDVLKGDIIRDVTNLRLVADMVVLLQDRDRAVTFSDEMDDDIVILNGKLDQMEALSQASGEQTLIDTFAAYRSAVEEFCDRIPEARDIAMAEDSQKARDEAYAVIEELVPTINKINELTEQCEAAIAADVANAKETMLFTINSVQIFMVVVAIAIIVIIIITILIIARTVSAPARHASSRMNTIIDKISREEGDLTERIDVTTRDEIGQLAGGINQFMEQLQNIMKTLKEQSQTMLETAGMTMDHVNESNDNASNVSAAMEELAASMEEVAATIADIATASEEMLASVQSMNGQAEEGAGLVLEIKQRAQEINENTVESKRTIDNMITEIRGTLEGAVEESRSVDKINELTDEILNISSQTNLLALNASIEAARAGEAGKGFAVVADEIRVLAENSKNTANNIQEISQMVTAAVAKLARNAESMLQFIDQKVLSDYDGFVGVAKQYYNDADNMNQILSDFSMYTSDIEDTMKNVNEGINGISTTVDESAKGVASAAENAGQLVDAISQIQEEAQMSQDISNQLSREVKRFKNV